jgi:hypothetical protein
MDRDGVGSFTWRKHNIVERRLSELISDKDGADNRKLE